jgi:hypothetical protein
MPHTDRTCINLSSTNLNHNLTEPEYQPALLDHTCAYSEVQKPYFKVQINHIAA